MIGDLWGLELRETIPGDISMHVELCRIFTPKFDRAVYTTETEARVCSTRGKHANTAAEPMKEFRIYQRSQENTTYAR